jgi:hypothetical protein
MMNLILHMTCHVLSLDLRDIVVMDLCCADSDCQTLCLKNHNDVVSTMTPTINNNDERYQCGLQKIKNVYGDVWE